MNEKPNKRPPHFVYCKYCGHQSVDLENNRGLKYFRGKCPKCWYDTSLISSKQKINPSVGGRSLTVSLETNLSEGQIKSIIASIKLLRGVLEVKSTKDK